MLCRSVHDALQGQVVTDWFGSRCHRNACILSFSCGVQRLRDQIRGWAVLPEVRDPAQLLEARRSIELDMVRRWHDAQNGHSNTLFQKLRH